MSGLKAIKIASLRSRKGGGDSITPANVGPRSAATPDHINNKTPAAARGSGKVMSSFLTRQNATKEAQVMKTLTKDSSGSEECFPLIFACGAAGCAFNAGRALNLLYQLDLLETRQR